MKGTPQDFLTELVAGEDGIASAWSNLGSSDFSFLSGGIPSECRDLGELRVAFLHKADRRGSVIQITSPPNPKLNPACAFALSERIQSTEAQGFLLVSQNLNLMPSQAPLQIEFQADPTQIETVLATRSWIRRESGPLALLIICLIFSIFGIRSILEKGSFKNAKLT